MSVVVNLGSLTSPSPAGVTSVAPSDHSVPISKTSEAAPSLPSATPVYNTKLYKIRSYAKDPSAIENSFTCVACKCQFDYCLDAVCVLIVDGEDLRLCRCPSCGSGCDVTDATVAFKQILSQPDHDATDKLFH